MYFSLPWHLYLEVYLDVYNTYMRNRFLFLILIFLFAGLIIIYFPWFTHSEIIGGDWPFYFTETIKLFPPLVPSWATWQGNGLGGTDAIYFLNSFQFSTFFVSSFFHIPWNITYKIFWFGLFLSLSFFSPLFLIRKIFPKIDILYMFLSGFIYTTNTYILMVVAGGQMGVALAYALSPLVLGLFIQQVHFMHRFNLKSSLLTGLALSMQMLFDPRLSYLTMAIVVLYAFFCFIWFFNTKENLTKKNYKLFRYAFNIFIVPLAITMLLHIFWILPLVMMKQNTIGMLGENYTGSGIIKFLSFANFSDALSLLHPNWPENLFGKTYFMRPQFLLLPILAYATLLFLSDKSKESLQAKKSIIFFSVIGIIGAFLGKGANPPFGEIYIFLFEQFPGFIAFRDPTKWYLLVALSFSILLPWFAYLINYKIKKIQSLTHLRKYIGDLLVLGIVCYLFFLISPALLGQLKGTFKIYDVPNDYIVLKDFLHSQKDFSRTLWIPLRHRFSYFSNIHSPVEAIHLFKATDSAEAIKDIKKEGPDFFAQLSIKYIIVPFDSTADIFLKDRKYNEKEYKETVRMMQEISWLKKLDGFGNIAVFETPQYYDHFWLTGNGKVTVNMIDTSYYKVSINIKSPQQLIFAENYNSYWQAKIGNTVINSQKTKNGLNSFSLQKKGEYEGEIVFVPNVYYFYGRVISFLSLLAILLLLFKYRYR